MGRYRAAICLMALAVMTAVQAKETIVMMRHGEKPDGGLGQLNCKGLQRSLALPKVLIEQFGHPDMIMAPNPSALKRDSGQPYDYIRPLATIEPTAIRLGMPVDTNIAFDDIAKLEAALEAPALADKMVFVAWEHYFIEQVARAMVTHSGGDGATVPTWDGKDFDSIYVVTLDHDANGKPTTAFRVAHEHLDGVSTTCP